MGSAHIKVLLVDDSGTARHIQKKQLNELGVTDIVEASDGFQAIDLAKSAKPDLILMDWQMPKLTGILALRLLKKDPLNVSLPVFLTSTDSDKRHVLVAAQSGAAGYLLKPISLEVLREKLSPFLPDPA